MKLTCPVCGHEVEPTIDHLCPVCDTDLSTLVLYQAEKASSTAEPKSGGYKKTRWLWLLLLLLLIPIIWWGWQNSFLRREPEERIVIVTATNDPAIISVLATTLIEIDTLTPTQTQTQTPTQVPEPTETETPTQTSLPNATANLDLYCRSGAGISYPIVGYFLEGDSSEVQAALADQSWIMISHPTKPNQACWVWTSGVEISGDLALVPVLLPSQ